jgi:acyl CoA:acetate/3-ketoacid CoA transferase beta subunit
MKTTIEMGIEQSFGRTAPMSAELIDVVTCALARQVHADDVVGVGLGTPLALCGTMVALRTSAKDATVLCGGAVSPRATLAECMRHETDGRTPGFVPHLDTMDMAERQAMTLQFFRPAQVGPDGSANTSRVQAGDRLIRFPGALALPDTPNLMPRVLFYHTAHEPRNLPADVSFKTVAGGGIERGGYRSLGATALITDKAVIAFSPEGPRLVSYHPGESVESVVAATGFGLDVEGAVETPAPTDAERHALETVDPSRLRETEFKSQRRRA